LRVFTTKVFARFARKERLDDRQLCEAIARAERGLVDADLGGNLIKQRVARSGRGRSGGYRTVVAFRASQRSVFLYGFAKSSATTSMTGSWPTSKSSPGTIWATATQRLQWRCSRRS
jgi:hypothetical protein